MRLKRSSSSATKSQAARRYRWLIVWLGLACAVAMLLLANAVRDYSFVSRVLATQQVHHQMTQMSAQVEQELRRDGLSADTLARALGSSTRAAEAIDLRNPQGELLEHFGTLSPAGVFSLDQERVAFARHDTLSRTIANATGEIVVQAVPLRIPPRASTAPSTSTTGPPRPMILEIALPLKDADAAVLTPIRRNLTINCVAALSLLATVLLSWAGLRSYEQGRRFEEQIEIARQVQSRLLPASDLEVPGVQIATEYKPSEQVGGDFYDLFPIEFPDTSAGLACVIGDVSGKGIPAALLMGVIHGAVRTACWQTDAAEHEAESRRLNRLLCDRASGNRFASMFWSVYDPQGLTLRYVNAGHCPPFLIGRRNGKLVATRLDKGGPVLGLLPDVGYEAATVAISPGDLLVLHSDGLVEATNAAGQEFGDERLAALLEAHADETPTQLRERIVEALASFAAKNVAQDDLTFAVIRFEQIAPPTCVQLSVFQSCRETSSRSLELAAVGLP